MLVRERGDVQLERRGQLRGESRQRNDHELSRQLGTADGDHRQGRLDNDLRGSPDADVSGRQFQCERLE